MGKGVTTSKSNKVTKEEPKEDEIDMTEHDKPISSMKVLEPGSLTKKKQKMSIDSFDEQQDKIKEEQEEIKEKKEQEKKPIPITGLYFGYKIVEDENVKELRLPKQVIDLLRNATQGFDYSKEDIIPGRHFVCTRCGFKMNAIRGKLASMFFCPREGRELHQT